MSYPSSPPPESTLRKLMQHVQRALDDLALSHADEGELSANEPEKHGDDDAMKKVHNYETREGCFEALFADYDTHVAKQASRKERQENGFISSTLVYGEVEFKPFSELLKRLNDEYQIFPKGGGTFVDVGCGSGKAVFAAALTHDFNMCMGIEILASLHEIAVKVLGVWRTDIIKHLTGKVIHTRFSFTYDDATLASWSHADVVFMNSTCFDEALMEKLALQAEKLATGVIVITATKPLPSKQFQELEQCTMAESWGDATIFVQRKQ